MNRIALRAAAAAAVLLGAAAVAPAALVTYVTFMDGPSESPPNNSPGTGFARVDIDTDANFMRVRADFTGLIGTTTAAHIHAPTTDPFTGTAGVATQTPSFVGFPLGVTSGTMDQTFDTEDAATWNAAFITANGGTPAGAEAAFAAALADGKAYFNIHTTQFSGGEIRGFLAVPEPASAAVLGAGGLLLLARRRR